LSEILEKNLKKINEDTMGEGEKTLSYRKFLFFQMFLILLTTNSVLVHFAD